MLRKGFDIIPEHITKLAVACSGGADSLCLTLQLADWCAAHNIALTALHVNHHLRLQATQEADCVKQWLIHKNIQCHILTVGRDLRKEGNIQAAARHARYALLTKWCKDNNISYLCVAHHADDQAETFLMRLARGSGVDGLSAMKPVTQYNGITVLRPYLYHTKAEIIAILKKDHQSWIDDPSNKNKSFTRVVMRDVLPVLQEASITSRHIVNVTSHLARASDCLHQMVNEWIVEQGVWKGAYYAALPTSVFQSLHKELALRVVSQCLLHFHSDELRFKHLEPLVHALQKEAHRKVTLHHCVIHPYRNRILIYRERRHMQGGVIMKEDFLWDHRVRIHKTLGENYRCAALGEAGLALLKAQKYTLPSLPASLLHTLPAIWHLEELYAVPHIDYYTQPCNDTLLRILHHTDQQLRI